MCHGIRIEGKLAICLINYQASESGRVREPSGGALCSDKRLCHRIRIKVKSSILDMIGLNPDEFGSALEEMIS